MSRSFRCYILFLHQSGEKVVQECLDSEETKELDYESTDILKQIGLNPRPAIEHLEGSGSGIWYFKVNKGKTHMLFVSKDTDYKYVNIFFTKLISLVASMDLSQPDNIARLRAKSSDLLQVFDTEAQQGGNTSSLGLQAAVNSGMEMTEPIHHQDAESMSFVMEGTQLSSVPVVATNTSTQSGIVLKVCLVMLGISMFSLMIFLIASGPDD